MAVRISRKLDTRDAQATNGKGAISKLTRVWKSHDIRTNKYEVLQTLEYWMHSQKNKRINSKQKKGFRETVTKKQHYVPGSRGHERSQN